MQVRPIVAFIFIASAGIFFSQCSDVPEINIRPPSFSLYAARYQNAWQEKEIRIQRQDGERWCVTLADPCVIYSASETLANLQCEIKTNADVAHYQISFSCSDTAASEGVCEAQFGSNGVVGKLWTLHEPDATATVIFGDKQEDGVDISQVNVLNEEACLNY